MRQVWIELVISLKEVSTPVEEDDSTLEIGDKTGHKWYLLVIAARAPLAARTKEDFLLKLRSEPESRVRFQSMPLERYPFWWLPV